MCRKTHGSWIISFMETRIDFQLKELAKTYANKCLKNCIYEMYEMFCFVFYETACSLHNYCQYLNRNIIEISSHQNKYKVGDFKAGWVLSKIQSQQ